MQQQAHDGQRRDAWERLGWLWTVIYYGALLFSGISALTDGSLTTNERATVIVLVVALALWHALLVWLGQHRVWRNVRLSLPLLILAVAVWYPLVFVHPIFYFMLAGLFPAIYIYLKTPLAIALSLVVAVLAVLAQTGGSLSLSNPIVWIYAVSTGMAVFLGVWISAIIGQSIRRRELIKQLESTREQLAAAERREGALQERERLAREIHDRLSQGFTSIVMHLEAAEQALPDDLPTMRRHLDRARETARDSLREAREVVHDLRP
ncbi:MAG: sensor histidine kinase, partial [Chloroflexota bacterium]